MFKYPYQNVELTIHERVTDLLGRMSVQEKIGQVNQHLYGWECYTNQGTIELTENFKQHVQWGGGVGALYGLFRADPWSQVDFTQGTAASDSWRVVNKVQQYIIENSRWKIPALIVEECPHGHQGLGGVSYPTNIGRSNSFDPELVAASSRLMARELAAKGVHLALVSTLDLAKDPRWGRTEECFGEDPYLAARLSEAVIAGFQGELITEGQAFVEQTTTQIGKKREQIGVVLKHCIAQGEAQGGHNSGTVTIGSREFADVYQPLLASAKNAVGVMAAYNDIDGVPCHINGQLFQENLKGQLGFQGLVMADGIALDRLADVFDSQTAAAGAALAAGIDLSLWDDTYTKIAEGIGDGKVAEADLDQAVYRVLSVKFLLGLFEQPYAEDPAEELAEILAESQKVNLALAKESLTLLKNDGLLPLADNGQKIAVIGPNANELYNLLGDYTAPQEPALLERTIYHEVKRLFANSEVVYAQGCEVRRGTGQEPLLAEAEALAAEADVLVLALGGSSARNFDMEFLKNGAVSSKGINMDSGENVDVASLSLGGQQLALLERLARLNKPIVSVLIQGRPYDISDVAALSSAVLIGWFPGQAGGEAIARTLLGDNNPNGRLSVSYPVNSQQLPVYYYQRAASKQDDYYDGSGRPLYEFGSGLSYTTFEYSDLKTELAGDQLQVSVKVKNTGVCDGLETVLLFVRLYGGQVIQRHKLLRGFAKAALAVGEETTFVFDLDQTALSFADSDMKIKVAQKVKVMVHSLEEEIDLNF